jgi:ribosome-associated toxin RatA of RatAB toxin-antitoxin module
LAVIKKSALVDFSQQQMFDLVSDIEAYPQFMPGCKGAKILTQGPDWIEARLDLAQGPLDQSFTTRNIIQAPQSMRLTLVDGPFSKFDGTWEFTALSDSACKILLSLEFQFKNRLLGLAAGPLFESVANRQVEALCARAKSVYGAV